MSDQQNQTWNTDLNGQVRHAKIPLPKPTVWASHPFKNADNHESLLQYLKQRLFLGMQQRDSELKRLVQIDKNVAGWMRLSEEDRKRQRQQQKDGIPLSVEISLPLAYVHLDDMMTYFATTFAPNRGMFYQAGKPEEQDSAQQIVTLMNNHAIYDGYYRQILLGLYSLLKYNVGGFHVYWAEDKGPKISIDPNTQQEQVTQETRWQGNRLEAVDKYNILYDSSVPPGKLHCDGEFVALPSAKSYYWLQNKASQGVYFNCDSALGDWNGQVQHTYYRNPPKQANMEADDSGGTDWKAILSAGNETAGFGTGFEVTPIYIRLNPTEFGLVDGNATQKAARNRFEVWRFTILNNRYIIDATYMNNIHGYLPVIMGVFNDDIMSTAQKSPAEILQPLQNFASSLLNVHVQASRKKLWNLTVYDPSGVDLKSIPKGEVAARVAIKPEAQGRDVRTMIWQPPGDSDTQETMKDLGAVMDIINQFFPTQSLPGQIASIDRAVDSQVAAVQQGANRRQQKAARLLDDSIFRQLRFAMYYNIIQYQQDAQEVMDYYSGKPVQIDLAKLRDTDLPFIIGQGLKSLDRMAAASQLQKIIFALIQAPQAQQGIDLLGLINYWTDMIDIDVDMNQFKVAPPPQQQVGPDGQPIAGVPAVDATGNAIHPATAPSAVTSPIYGGHGAG